jgi:hypothetical protein
VKDCFLLARESEGAGEELIACVVPAESFSLPDRLRTVLPPKLLPSNEAAAGKEKEEIRDVP